MLTTKCKLTAIIRSCKRRDNLNQVDQNVNNVVKLYRDNETLYCLGTADVCIPTHSRISNTHAPQSQATGLSRERRKRILPRFNALLQPCQLFKIYNNAVDIPLLLETSEEIPNLISVQHQCHNIRNFVFSNTFINFFFSNGQLLFHNLYEATHFFELICYLLLLLKIINSI